MWRQWHRVIELRVTSVVPQQQSVLARTLAADCTARDVHSCTRQDRVPTLFQLVQVFNFILIVVINGSTRK